MEEQCERCGVSLDTMETLLLVRRNVLPKYQELHDDLGWVDDRSKTVLLCSYCANWAGVLT